MMTRENQTRLLEFLRLPANHEPGRRRQSQNPVMVAGMSDHVEVLKNCSHLFYPFGKHVSDTGHFAVDTSVLPHLSSNG